MNSAKEKRCHVCLETKPISEFYRQPNYSKTSTIYYMRLCKKCNNAQSAAYRKTEKGKQAQARGSKKWGQTQSGREHLRSGWRKYHHSEHGRRKAYLYEQRDYVKQRKSNWKKSEAGKISAANYAHGRRRNILKSSYRLTLSDWETIKKTFFYRCAYCGAQPSTLEIEHVVPLSRGGLHEFNNIVPVCSHCNRRKGPKLLSEWIGGKSVKVVCCRAV
jgi:5-methylcytosine-specific restriction endonuclease McrA